MDNHLREQPEHEVTTPRSTPQFSAPKKAPGLRWSPGSAARDLYAVFLVSRP